MEKRDALLEIRIENIPGRFIISAKEQIIKYAREFLSENVLFPDEIQSFGTYKRLVLYLKGLAERTEEKTEKIYGPSASVWKTPDGQWTPQSIGFAKKCGTTPDKLLLDPGPSKHQTKAGAKCGTLYFEKKIPSKPSVKVLCEIFPKIISKLVFPKNMVWEDTRFKFARPIRGIVALYGDKLISFSIADIKSSRKTVGLSAKGSKEITIKSAERYFRTLENINVLVDDSVRKKTLVSEIESASKRMKLQVEMDEELICENLYLVEYPVCVVSSFSSDFLKVPYELVQLVMKKQLKFFTVLDSENNLQPYLVGIRDGVSKKQKNVEEGFKNVLEARLKDAIFFYQRDLNTPLEEMTENLKNIMFQEKLGTMLDKTNRVKSMALFLANQSGKDFSREIIDKSSSLVYADLSSHAVREFPELQGTMGYYYAINANLGEKVAEILKEFYLPVSAKTKIPSFFESAMVSLAGKIDTLAGDFAVGIVPTGSEDPHGLRRQALGIARIILEHSIELSLKNAVEYSISLLPEVVLKNIKIQTITNQILDFIWQRAENLLMDQGFLFDELRAVREHLMRTGNLLDCAKRVHELHIARKNSDFQAIILSYKRAKNILRQANYAGDSCPSEKFFEKEEEKILYGNVVRVSKKTRELILQKNYQQALQEILSIKDNLDRFFDNVMVMVNDESIRINRLKIVKSFFDLFNEIADLSQLQ